MQEMNKWTARTQYNINQLITNEILTNQSINWSINWSINR